MMQMMGMNYEKQQRWTEGNFRMLRSSNLTRSRSNGRLPNINDPQSYFGRWPTIFCWRLPYFDVFNSECFQHQTSGLRPPRLQWVFDRRASGCLGPGGSQTLHLGFGWKKPAEAGENGQPMSVKTQGQRGWLSVVGRWGVPWIRSLVPEDGWKRVQMVEARLSSFHVARRISKTLYINSNLFSQSFWLVSLLVKIQQRLVAETKSQRSEYWCCWWTKSCSSWHQNGRYSHSFHETSRTSRNKEHNPKTASLDFVCQYMAVVILILVEEDLHGASKAIDRSPKNRQVLQVSSAEEINQMAQETTLVVALAGGHHTSPSGGGKGCFHDFLGYKMMISNRNSSLFQGPCSCFQVRFRGGGPKNSGAWQSEPVDDRNLASVEPSSFFVCFFPCFKGFHTSQLNWN